MYNLNLVSFSHTCVGPYLKSRGRPFPDDATRAKPNVFSILWLVWNNMIHFFFHVYANHVLKTAMQAAHGSGLPLFPQSSVLTGQLSGADQFSDNHHYKIVMLDTMVEENRDNDAAGMRQPVKMYKVIAFEQPRLNVFMFYFCLGHERLHEVDRVELQSLSYQGPTCAAGGFLVIHL